MYQYSSSVPLAAPFPYNPWMPTLYHGGSHVNNSLDMEVLILQDHFRAVGSHCLVVLRFVSLWFFPAWFLITQMLPYVMQQRRLWKQDSSSSQAHPVQDDDGHQKDFIDTLETWLLLQAPRELVKRLLFATAPSGLSEVGQADQAVISPLSPQQHVAANSSNNNNNNSMPKHVAVIMDGNRRYGKQHLGSSLRGHRAGGEKLREFVRWCRGAGVEMLTVYAFSTENWSRPQQEVDLLMELFSDFFEQMLLDAEEIGIRIRFIASEPERLPEKVRSLMERVETETRRHVGNSICVNVCASYGSRSAILRAAQEEVSSTVHQQQDHQQRLDERSFMRRLAVSHLERQQDGGKLFCERDGDLWAAPDVLIRTSGEMRLSNFLLMEMAYAEMFFWNVTWPEVTKEMLVNCLNDFSKSRQRRMGK